MMTYREVARECKKDFIIEHDREPTFMELEQAIRDFMEPLDEPEVI
jgi:hypothetical protein